MNRIEEIISNMNIDIKKKDVFFVWHLDDKFSILEASDGVEKILGYNSQEIINSDFTDFMLKQEGRYFVKEPSDLDGLTKKEFSITTIFKRKDKTHVVLETRGKTIYSNNQKVSGYEGLTFYK